MKLSVTTGIGNIVLSREICNYGGRIRGLAFVYSPPDLRICVGHMHATVVESMMWTRGWDREFFLHWHGDFVGVGPRECESEKSTRVRGTGSGH